MIKVAAPVGLAQELVPVRIFHLFWPKSLRENNWSNGRNLRFFVLLVVFFPFLSQQVTE